MTELDQRYSELGRFIEDRVSELGLKKGKVADEAGVSDATLREIMRGVPRDRSPATWSRLTRVLALPDGSLRNVAFGDWTVEDIKTAMAEDARAGDEVVAFPRAVVEVSMMVAALTDRLKEAVASDRPDLVPPLLAMLEAEAERLSVEVHIADAAMDAEDLNRIVDGLREVLVLPEHLATAALSGARDPEPIDLSKASKTQRGARRQRQE